LQGRKINGAEKTSRSLSTRRAAQEKKAKGRVEEPIYKTKRLFKKICSKIEGGTNQAEIQSERSA